VRSVPDGDALFELFLPLGGGRGESLAGVRSQLADQGADETADRRPGGGGFHAVEAADCAADCAADPCVSYS